MSFKVVMVSGVWVGSPSSMKRCASIPRTEVVTFVGVGEQPATDWVGVQGAGQHVGERCDIIRGGPGNGDIGSHGQMPLLRHSGCRPTVESCSAPVTG